MNNYFLPENFFDLSETFIKGLFSSCKNTWEILPKIDEYISQFIKLKPLPGQYDNTKSIFVAEGAIIGPEVYLEGSCLIFNKCKVGHASLIRRNCILLDGSTVGHAGEIKNSILLNNSSAAHFNYIGDSIIGNNVNIAGGAILANFRFDKQPVEIKVNGQKINTGLEKFGSIIGDDSSIGVNSVLNPGTILGKKTVIYPLRSVTGVHRDGEIIK